MKNNIVLLACLALFCLNGCGQKGDLYLPTGSSVESTPIPTEDSKER